MKEHPSGIFIYEKESTRLAYSQLAYKFTNTAIENSCIEKIKNAMKRNSMDLGIDFTKPLEELELDENHYQIEYFFVGEIHVEDGCITDEEIGINIYKENRFGQERFNSSKLLNLTLIIEKNTVPNILVK
ncbi:hypothetical protein EI427_17070 [Flammeovirga pectinis]|uniref:Uncharacterized protein n=1 Tax=Flammeovirga pectinis TaxID=2494373 RepID=A0A3Q9FSV4_9BACT|nr:hypothetical protein [Flammeovirga pectinis]AZQ63875.1 hypothetical protein EI427_17070 [Flammeovirga pectinis]